MTQEEEEHQHRHTTPSPSVGASTSANNSRTAINREGGEKVEKVPIPKAQPSSSSSSSSSAASSSFSSFLSSPSPVTPSTPLLHGSDKEPSPNEIYEETEAFVPKIRYTNAIYTTLSVYRLNTAMTSLGLTTLLCFIVFISSRISSDDDTQQSLLSKPGIYELFASIFCLISVFLSVVFLRTNQRRIGSGASFFSLMSKSFNLKSFSIFISNSFFKLDYLFVSFRSYLITSTCIIIGLIGVNAILNLSKFSFALIVIAFEDHYMYEWKGCSMTFTRIALSLWIFVPGYPCLIYTFLMTRTVKGIRDTNWEHVN